MVFCITTTRGDDGKELSKFVPLFNLSKKVTWRGAHPSRYEQACWTIEIKTLEELVAFTKQVKNSLVIDAPSEALNGHDLPTIEIYNDYRE